MQHISHIWTAFLPILTLVALASAIQRELENTDKNGWHWIIKKQPGVIGVSVKVNFQRDILKGMLLFSFPIASYSNKPLRSLFRKHLSLTVSNVKAAFTRQTKVGKLVLPNSS